jgi:hypothetical protein
MTMTEAHTTIGALRKTHGETFAPEFRSDDTLSSLLQSTGTASIDEYLKHSQRGMRIVGTSSDVLNTIISHTAAVLPTPALSALLKNIAGKYIADLATHLARGTQPAPIDEEDLSSLRKNRTGVDNTIWVSPKLASHAPRIKIAIDPPDSLTAGGKTATMTIHQPHVVTGERVPTHIIKQAEAFIDLNHDVLLRFWNGEIDTSEMLEQIQKP